MDRVIKARELIDDIVETGQVVYGVSTGCGKFATSVIEKGKLIENQYNIVRSHAAGVGNPISPGQTRRLLALRINMLAKGHSGISLSTLQQLIHAFNGRKGVSNKLLF